MRTHIYVSSLFLDDFCTRYFHDQVFAITTGRCLVTGIKISFEYFLGDEQAAVCS